MSGSGEPLSLLFSRLLAPLLVASNNCKMNVSRENKERMIAITVFTARHLLSMLLHV
jgi:hypothetical protein